MQRQEVAQFAGPEPSGRAKSHDFWSGESCLPRVFQKSIYQPPHPGSRLQAPQKGGTANNLSSSHRTCHLRKNTTIFNSDAICTADERGFTQMVVPPQPIRVHRRSSAVSCSSVSSAASFRTTDQETRGIHLNPRAVEYWALFDRSLSLFPSPVPRDLHLSDGSAGVWAPLPRQGTACRCLTGETGCYLFELVGYAAVDRFQAAAGLSELLSYHLLGKLT